MTANFGDIDQKFNKPDKYFLSNISSNSLLTTFVVQKIRDIWGESIIGLVQYQEEEIKKQ